MWNVGSIEGGRKHILAAHTTPNKKILSQVEMVTAPTVRFKLGKPGGNATGIPGSAGEGVNGPAAAAAGSAIYARRALASWSASKRVPCDVLFEWCAGWG